MNLSVRLTLAFATLLLVLGLAAAWWLDRLTEDMRTALGETATEVGASLVTVFSDERVIRRVITTEDDGSAGEAGAVPHAQSEQRAEGSGKGDSAATEVIDIGTAHWVEHEVHALPADADKPATAPRITRMMVNGRELTPEQLAALPDDAPLRNITAGHAPMTQDFRFEVKRASSERPVLVMHHQGAGPTLIPLPDSRIDRTLDGFRRQLGWGLGLILLLGTALAALLARRIAAPLAQLSHAAERVGHGELGVQTAPSGPPEVRRSIAAFNAMSTELAQMQAERDRLRADRELAELGEIGRGLAHSLRNPLHALGLSLDLLAEGSAPTRAAQLAEAGRDQLQRIDQTLRGFLALSASAGARVEEIELAGLLDDVILEARQRAQGRVRIERGACAVHLPAVAAELRIVVHALVINAVEASPEGACVRIEVAVDGDGGVQLRISDEGEGIPAELRDRLFQPHVSSKPTGAGMGLYLAERLVRLRYRGSIALVPNTPRGTVAEVRLMPRETEHAG